MARVSHSFSSYESCDMIHVTWFKLMVRDEPGNPPNRDFETFWDPRSSKLVSSSKNFGLSKVIFNLKILFKDFSFAYRNIFVIKSFDYLVIIEWKFNFVITVEQFWMSIQYSFFHLKIKIILEKTSVKVYHWRIPIIWMQVPWKFGLYGNKSKSYQK